MSDKQKSNNETNSEANNLSTATTAITASEFGKRGFTNSVKKRSCGRKSKNLRK